MRFRVFWRHSVCIMYMKQPGWIWVFHSSSFFKRFPPSLALTDSPFPSRWSSRNSYEFQREREQRLENRTHERTLVEKLTMERVWWIGKWRGIKLTGDKVTRGEWTIFSLFFESSPPIIVVERQLAIFLTFSVDRIAPRVIYDEAGSIDSVSSSEMSRAMSPPLGSVRTPPQTQPHWKNE